MLNIICKRMTIILEGKMKRFLFFLFVASAGMQVLNGCKSAQTTASNSVEVSEGGNKIILTDQTGKKWDVSHAVKKYGFEINRFEFGLGPFAIRPFIDPEFLSPGDTGYPADGADFLIMGTDIGGDARAYRITDMSWHEVADDQFGEAHVAVAY